jgi:hypothetical protein
MFLNGMCMLRAAPYPAMAKGHLNVVCIKHSTQQIETWTFIDKLTFQSCSGFQVDSIIDFSFLTDRFLEAPNLYTCTEFLK